ncbi:MAG TPA: endo-1,4-beta-xylanase, partial [Chitinophagaceae bacterium]|nr:endo-1,4-beta-xylanase [Chitinophagaceae bacterium]
MFSVIAGMVASCKKTDNFDNPGTGSPIDTAGPLKTAASFPIGMAIDYSLFKNNASYRNTVAREADQVTFGYHMKHGAIVKDDGSFDFTTADELLNLVNAAALEVFGHTLVWHENQNGNYLRSLTVSSGFGGPNLLPGGDFEGGSGVSGTGNTLFTNWNVLVGGNAAGTYTAVTGNNS